jgi:hypothetical protein
MTRGASHRFKSFRRNRLAASAFRRDDARERYGDKNHLNAPKLAKTLEAK